MTDLPKHKIKENIDHEDKATTTVTVLDFDEYDEEIELPLEDTIERLQNALEEIPEEYRSRAMLSIHASGEYAMASAKVTFNRLETDEEFADRKRWLDSIHKEDEAKERRELARLRAKYER